VPEPAPPLPDDLKRIEGIGPKISRLLQATGITTFAQLAATDVNQLRRILRGAGITIADPGTWPEQASLAAADRWDELEALQDELKGGRRV
jgi:predicted flap endonuclease-1-like 5' DNA nuclease